MNSPAKTSLAVGAAAYVLCILVPIVLKLAGVFTASWWFVLVALWGPIAFTLTYALVSLLAVSFRKRPTA